MASNSNSFNPNACVSLSDLQLLQSNVNITNKGEFTNIKGIPNIRLTSPIYWAGEDDYGKSHVLFKVTKEEYDSYLSYYNANIKPKLEALFVDPNAVALGRVNKKKKSAALEVKHASFYEDSKSDNGGMVFKLRLYNSSLLNLVMDDGTSNTIKLEDIKWKSMAEAFVFFGLTKDREGIYYLRGYLKRLYVKHDEELAKIEEVDTQPYVPSFFLPSSYTIAEAISEI
jgi:hypothetical protein